MSRDDIFEKIQEVLDDALGVDEDEVTPEASLTADLGAESIDFLDIVFRLEKSFDFKESSKRNFYFLKLTNFCVQLSDDIKL